MLASRIPDARLAMLDSRNHILLADEPAWAVFRDEVAAFLSGHPAVTEVIYPGLESHPGHDLATRQMRRFGGMISFRVKGGEEKALEVCGRTKIIILGESLGGVDRISLQMTNPRLAHADLLRGIELLGTEVVPRVAASA